MNFQLDFVVFKMQSASMRLLLDAGCGMSWRCSLCMSYSVMQWEDAQQDRGNRKRKLRTQSFFLVIASNLSDTSCLSHDGLKHREKNGKMALNFETFLAFKTKISLVCSVQIAQINEFNLLKTNL